MANLPKFTDKDFRNEGHEVDFDMKKLYNMPGIEQMIFFFVNFDKCRKEIMRYENARNTASQAKKHPKEYKPQAIDLLRCHSRNLHFEPICLESFNDARECMFRLEGHLRLCENELNLFEECVHDPKRFEKFIHLATPVQKEPKEFFSNVMRADPFN